MRVGVWDQGQGIEPAVRDPILEPSPPSSRATAGVCLAASPPPAGDCSDEAVSGIPTTRLSPPERLPHARSVGARQASARTGPSTTTS
jgi:hypothetical protein